jgi:hypothetical protein
VIPELGWPGGYPPSPCTCNSFIGLELGGRLNLVHS